MRPGKAYDAVSTSMVVRGRDEHVKYMIDGDLHEARGELRVTVGPRVRLVVMR
jgi:hypothetical protein